MEHPGVPEVTTPVSTIPGWRVIRSDAGRYWASREQPFPGDTAWGRPPFRTVDADTFGDLKAEVDRQEAAARDDSEKTAGQVTSQVGGQVTGQVAGQVGGQVATEGAAGRTAAVEPAGKEGA